MESRIVLVSQERPGNCDHLLGDLGLSCCRVLSGSWFPQRKRSTSSRAAGNRRCEVFLKCCQCPGEAAVSSRGLGLEFSDCRICPFNISSDPEEHVIGILGLLTASERIELEHKERTDPRDWNRKPLLRAKKVAAFNGYFPSGRQCPVDTRNIPAGTPSRSIVPV